MKRLLIILFVLFYIQTEQKIHSQTPIPQVGSGCAISFDGDDDYIETPASTDFEPGSGALSISLWIKLPNQVNGNVKIIDWWRCGATPSCNGSATYKLKLNGAGHLRWEVRDDFGNSELLSYSQSLFDNQWHHIAGTMDLQANTTHLYVDGVLVDENINTGQVSLTTGGDPVKIQIGRAFTAPNTSSGFFKGEIDEMRVWNYARTEAEIQADMCHSLQGNETGLVAYWDFNQCSGNELLDVTGNGNNGIIYNNPSWLTSGAPIGEESTAIYTFDWSNVELNLNIENDTFQVSNIENNPEGVHIYSIHQEPNSFNGIDVLPNNERYFGVFTTGVAGQVSSNFTVDYNYSQNPFVTNQYQDSLRLYNRLQNDSLTWNSIPGANNIFEEHISQDNENYRAEYILGLGETSCSFTLGEDQSICEPDSFEIVLPGTWLDFNWNTGEESQSIFASTTGDYIANTIDSLGCTSSDTIYIIINPIYDLLVDATVCEGESIFLAGAFQTEAGTYVDLFQTIEGCDSLVTTELTIVFPTFNEIDITACDSYVSPAGNNYTVSEIFTETLVNSAGCDSLLTIDLTIFNTTVTNLDPFDECDSLISPSGNFTWFSSGVYTDTLTTIEGCDSILFFDITFIESTDSTFTPQNICDQYLSPAGNIYIESGTYYETILNTTGCDSLITINLNINITPDPTILEPLDLICVRETLFELEAETEGGSWSGQGIINENLGAFNPSAVGLGSHLIVYEFEDVVCPSFESLQIEVIDCELLWQHIYVPNIFSPNDDNSNDTYYIYGDRIAEMTLVIYDRWGEKVFETTDLENGWDGTYNGEPVNASILAFQLSGTFISGLEFNDAGYITLIR